jgi:hypothetical protein
MIAVHAQNYTFAPLRLRTTRDGAAFCHAFVNAQTGHRLRESLQHGRAHTADSILPLLIPIRARVARFTLTPNFGAAVRAVCHFVSIKRARNDDCAPLRNH